jgi:transcriptional regulator with XRE-family HTH domain
MLRPVSDARPDSIGARLRPLIPERKQDHVEKAAGLSKGYLSRLLRDQIKHPDERLVRAVCVVLGADFEWVYYGRSRPDQVATPGGNATPASSRNWTVYSATRAAFAAEAALAIAAGVADDGVLDAATVLLGTSIPTRETARAAILEARRGVDEYRSLVPGLPGVSWSELGETRRPPSGAKRGST